MEYLQDLCRRMYVPRQNLSLDEGIMPYKGRLSIKTYNPMKPDKYGVKFYFLCEAVSGYVRNFFVYRGTHQSLHDIVFGLLGSLLGKGYHVYMDNFYNSVTLANELYTENTHCTGTLRLQRGAPPSLKALAGKKQVRNFYRHLRRNNTLVMCWYDTRLVSLVTTFHGPDTAPYVHKMKQRTRSGTRQVQEVHLDRPIAIGEYTKYMQGVDRLDQLMKYYSFLRKTRRWTKKILFYFIQIGLHNSYILYLKYSTDAHKLSHKQFHQLAIKSLLFFDTDEWPLTPPDERIVHAGDLQGDEHQPQQVPVPPAAPLAEDDSDDPDDPEAEAPRTPPPPPPAAAAADDDDVATPQTRKRIFDPPGRLLSYKKHKPEAVQGTNKRSQRRCRVCFMNGIRRDTMKQCCVCKIALCTSRDCFEVYHKRVKFWQSPPAGGSQLGRRGRRQSQQ